MRPRRSYTLASLTRKTPDIRKFQWEEVEQYAFNEIKWIVSCDNLLICPDFNETFKIHKDTSKFQLGAFISQKGKLIAFYSIKLTDTPKRYTLIEK